MAHHPQELEALSKAFSGLGIDENVLISILGSSNPELRESFRKGNPQMFSEDERRFERWNDHFVKLLKHEFVRFKNAVVVWTMHPWERDAKWVKEALKIGPKAYSIIVEIACTRSSDELLGARKAYHSLFDQSMEEDVASHVHGTDRKLLVSLVSAYRYEGKKVKEDTAKSEAKTLATAIKTEGKKAAAEDDEVVRILTTRSKHHLKEVYKYYKEITGDTHIVEDFQGSPILSDTLECLFHPQTYFSKVMDAALSTSADKKIKKGLTRVIVSRADHPDMKEISEEYHKRYGVPLAQRIEERANGNYKDFMLKLLARGN